MLKLLFHRETLEILGVHCFGPNASEIVHIGQAIMKQPAPLNTLEYFINNYVQLPNDGRSVPSRRPQRLQPIVLMRSCLSILWIVAQRFAITGIERLETMLEALQKVAGG